VYAGKVFSCETTIDMLANVFAERWSVLSCLTGYIVLCRSVLWSVISIMCSEAVLDASDVGRVLSMWVVGRLFGVMFAAVEAFIKLA